MRTTRVKLLLTTLLTLAYLLLMDPRSFYGLVFHEWAGLTICLFFILHVVLDWKFVKGVTFRFFRKLPARTRINYILDVLLLVGLMMVVWSGLPIARVIDFSWMGFDRENMRLWRLMHTSISTIVLVLAGLHLGLHWNWLMARLRRTQETTMLKKIVHAGLGIGITIGAIHAYEQVRFGVRTAVFFRMAFTSEGDFRPARARGDFQQRVDSERRRESAADSTRPRRLQRDSPLALGLN